MGKFNSTSAALAGAKSKRGKSKKTLFNKKLDELLLTDEMSAKVAEVFHEIVDGKYGDEIRNEVILRIADKHISHSNSIHLAEVQNELKNESLELKLAFGELTRRMSTSELEEMISSYYEERENA